MEKEIIIRTTIIFDSEKAPFSKIEDIEEMMAEFIKRDFLVEGVDIVEARSYFG